MKIPKNQITYVENPWAGGGNAGPAVEVIVGGLELATLVFMNLEEYPEGDVVVKGDRYREMDLQIIDTGYGLERFCWAAAGTPTIYEAIYPETVSWLRELSGFDANLDSMGGVDSEQLLGELSRLAGILNIDVGTDVGALYDKLVERLATRGIEIGLAELKSITEPLSAIYAIPDHLHALCNMLGDGLVPSNVKAGYLARMLARRTLKLRDGLGIDVSLAELGAHHLDINLDGSNFSQSREGILAILELEEVRYREMLRAGEAAVRTALQNVPQESESLEDEMLFHLAETRGLQPDMVVEIAKRLGWSNLSVRVGLAADMAARHASLAKGAAGANTAPSILADQFPATIPDFYEDTTQTTFEATVLACIELTPSQVESLNLSVEVTGIPSHAVVLDRTLFYPEGGGQLGDQGTLTDGSTVNVLDTRGEVGGNGQVILHLTDGAVAGGLTGHLNEDRRRQLMDHHTAVHIVGGSTRAILGPHIWQAGSNKGERYARLDVTHYQRLTRADLDAIEDHANSIISANPTVEKLVLDRAEADDKFGFSLYQGGPPKHQQIRVIKIGEHDVQACGGTHHDSAGSVGEVSIIRSSAVQDGVERLQIVAGETAREHTRRQERLLSAASDVLGVQPDELPASVQRFFDEWKSQQKEIEALKGEITRLRTSGGGGGSVEKGGVRYIILEGDGDLKQLQGMAAELTLDENQPTVAVLGSRDDGGKLLVAITENSVASERHDAVEVLRAISGHIGGGGGGRPTIAQGGGSNPEGLDDALHAAKTHLGLE
uniref:Alanine--tRNA ligase n=1 Tax=uncultured marine group II/III euryarchaeote KM3_44_G05 TaxID=1456448 RepID=A0A075H6W1_9EURY|nr:alanyl-tRNA synthetase (AARS, alaS) [uncultured marine group II/III euryarchaeote KM3_44_G05]